MGDTQGGLRNIYEAQHLNESGKYKIGGLVLNLSPEHKTMRYIFDSMRALSIAFFITYTRFVQL